MNAPHCPKCGGKPDWFLHPDAFKCRQCGFGEECLSEFSWAMAVRRELAEQALTVRAHSVSCDTWNLKVCRSVVDDDYIWLGNNPIRLPGEEA